MQGGAILLVCRWRGSGPWGWGGDQVTLAEPEQEGPLSGLLDLSQRLFSRSCPKITPNRSPLFWDHLGSPTPDQRGKEHSFWFLGGRGLERQPRLSETREHRARLLAPHPGAAGPGEVRVHTGGPCQDSCQGARPGSSPGAAAAPCLDSDPVCLQLPDQGWRFCRGGAHRPKPFWGSRSGKGKGWKQTGPSWASSLHSPCHPRQKSFWSGLCCSWPLGSRVQGPGRPQWGLGLPPTPEWAQGGLGGVSPASCALGRSAHLPGPPCPRL